MTSRDAILTKLRDARRTGKVNTRLLESAAPRPSAFLPVTQIEDASPDGLLARFSEELIRLKGEVFVCDHDQAARDQIAALLREHGAARALAWDFACIPLPGLAETVRGMGVEVIHPETHDEFRAETLSTAETAQVGITGVDAAAAATGTLIVTTAPGKGRIPTILAPIHIAIIRQRQIVPRIEDWVGRLRAEQMAAVRASANFCFITGPSRTGDIEMELILGVHGPGRVQAVIIRE
jgi:L-lactate dehydrogenase complex protein LldG